MWGVGLQLLVLRQKAANGSHEKSDYLALLKTLGSLGLLSPPPSLTHDDPSCYTPQKLQRFLENSPEKATARTVGL